ncbi:AAA family ATPase [Lactiplantibacillus plantarum]|uniref:AAA family ATPase n=1 Tax=Lactiplantibacillus plantarum TaxID=1590 RepID=UPI0021F6A33A|nr:AAA family ATPase [Lactiplantibacillus plantarum]MCW0154551.1 AAA family ATPase [Lactiplantibacillus plantarum]
MSWNEVKIRTPHLQENEVDLRFYKVVKNKKTQEKRIQDERIISIFGRNGSGKTTISNAVLHNSVDNAITDEAPSSSFWNASIEKNEEITTAAKLNNSEKLEAYVYNEQFVDKYVRVKDNENLEAIVMLSDNPDLTDSLKALETKETGIMEKIESAEQTLSNFESSTNDHNENNIHKKIDKQLKADGAWASIGKSIHALEVKQQVKTTAFKSIRDIDITGGTPAIAKQIMELLEDDLKDLEQIRQKKELPPFEMPTDKNDFSNVKKLLSTIVTMPTLNGIQERIMKSLSISGKNKISRIKDTFSLPETEYCPTCFRFITSSEKENLVQVINQVLNMSKLNAEEEFTNQLKSLKLDNHTLIKQDTDIASLFPKEVSAYNNAVEKYNEMVTKYLEAIAEKINNPYSNPDTINYDDKSLYKAIISAGRAIQKKTEEYNVVFKREKFLICEADLLNLNIAKYNNRELFEQFEAASVKHQGLKDNLITAKSPLADVKNNIDQIKAQLAEQKVALDQINDSLAHVFMARNRLKLIEGDNCYRVQSRGEFITTNQLSVGERNAISLCYFFSRINSNVRADQAYQRPIFVVLDDPISSFDFENKIGILSLLREELEKILFNNFESKVMVMTHDAEMFQHVAKIYSDIEERRRFLDKAGQPVAPKIISQSYQLISGRLTEAGTKSFNDYAQQLKEVYNYAMSDNQVTDENGQDTKVDYAQEDLFIGNTMRRVLEAFSTFCFRCSISAIFNDQDIMNIIPNIHREFLGTFMYRLVFNSESHSEESIKSQPDSNSADFISHSELIKTARLLIVFMDDLNALHLRKLIPDFDENEVQTWGQIAI